MWDWNIKIGKLDRTNLTEPTNHIVYTVYKDSYLSFDQIQDNFIRFLR